MIEKKGKKEANIFQIGRERVLSSKTHCLLTIAVRRQIENRMVFQEVRSRRTSITFMAKSLRQSRDVNS